MTKLNKAILDTSALISLYELNLLSYLNLLYKEVLIPNAVEKEFLENPKIKEERTTRFNYFIQNINTHSVWLKQCNEYGDDLISIYMTFQKMDKGEAETLAQNQSLESKYEVIIDEKFAKKFAKNNNMVVHGTLYLIATLDVKFKVCDYFSYAEKMMSETRTHVNQKIINLVYKKVQEEFL